jgi:copper chaperone CopZ
MDSSAITISTATTGSMIAVVQLKELDCQGCADNIRAFIGNCDGVHSVRASQATRQVTVEYEFPFTEEVLVQQLERAHFELAEVIKPQMELHENLPEPLSA